MTPEIRECPERVTAMKRQVIHPRDIGRAIGSGAQQLRDQLLAAGAVPTEAPYARYHSFTPEETDIEVGFEIGEDIAVEGVERSVLSAGREAVLVHTGSYRDIPRTFAALEAWVGDHAQARGAPREVYLSDPDATPVAELQTEIVYPIM